jgi:molybdopterin-guanine dinucleotide biosynthesis protein B
VASTRAPLIGIVGWKGSGKTTLIERLVATLAGRGLEIATIKHAHHELRPQDGATDGERHARAGALNVAVIAPSQWEIAGEAHTPPPASLEEAAARLGPADLVLVEGYKSAPIPKIEVRRLGSATKDRLAEADPDVIAIAADHPVEGEVPVFALDDVEAIAAFIEARLPHLRPPSRPKTSRKKRAGRGEPADFHRRRR